MSASAPSAPELGGIEGNEGPSDDLSAPPGSPGASASPTSATAAPSPVPSHIPASAAPEALPPAIPALPSPGPGSLPQIDAAESLGANHPVDVYVKRLRTPASRASTERKLDMVARVLAELWPQAVRLDHPRGARYGVPWLALTPIACERLRNELADRWSPNTANAALAAMRGVLRAAWLAGAFDADFRDRLFAGLTAVRGDADYVKIQADRARSAAQSPGGKPGLPDDWFEGDDDAAAAAGVPGRHLERHELSALWAAAANDPKPARGARNLAVLALLYACGLRAGEATAVDFGDLVFEPEPRVTVLGKGRKARVVPIPPAAARAIGRWILVRGRGAGPLLLPVLKSDKVLRRRANGRPARLSPQALTGICLALAERAGIAPFRAHDLRRSFAGQHLDAGTDIATTAALMGHASVDTTARYDRRPDRARREAQGRLWVPGDRAPDR